MNWKDSKNSNVLVGLYIDNTRNEVILNECLIGLSKQSAPIDLEVLVSDQLLDSDIEKMKGILDNQSIVTKKRDNSGAIVEETVTSEKELNYQITKASVKNFGELFNEVFNSAIENGYEFFSLIEQEDVTALNWFKTVKTFSEENPDTGIFLPLAKNTVNGVFNGFMNEISWAEGMAEEAGKMDMNLLLRFNCANPLGAVYKVDKLKDYAQQVDTKYNLIKDTIKISHYYEFFLRMVYNDVKIMTIPRIGYEMRYIRKDSFNHVSSKIPQDIATLPADKGGITMEEGRFWLDLAKKEYFFDEDRKIQYATK